MMLLFNQAYETLFHVYISWLTGEAPSALETQGNAICHQVQQLGPLVAQQQKPKCCPRQDSKPSRTAPASVGGTHVGPKTLSVTCLGLAGGR